MFEGMFKMKWYAAHVIMHIKFKDGNQDCYPVWENIYLVCGNSNDEAFEKAENIGKEWEGDSLGTLTWDERPATWVFAGVRKLIECDDSNNRPNNGTEITYSQFLVKNKESLDLLVNGEIVDITYEE